MTVKLMGALLVVGGCGGFGFAMAAAHRREEAVFRQYLIALEFMECELSCRLTPLPQLCQCTAGVVKGPIQELFAALCRELEQQLLPDAELCAHAALASVKGFSQEFRSQFLELGQTLGRFDLSGQLKGLERAAQRTKGSLAALEENRTARIRSYQTLGLCAGAALAILFI